jgi:hypothetical protein
VAVGAQQVGEQAGVAAVVLGAADTVARARSLHCVGVDRHHRKAGGDQRIDDQPREALHRDGQVGGRAPAGEPPRELLQARRVVPRLDAVDDRSGLPLDDADGVRRFSPVQSNDQSHVTFSPIRATLVPAGRTYASLIVRCSGGQPTAHQPVARLVLPAPTARRVSCGPSLGEGAGPSRRDTGSGRLTRNGATLPVRRVAQ